MRLFYHSCFVLLFCLAFSPSSSFTRTSVRSQRSLSSRKRSLSSLSSPAPVQNSPDQRKAENAAILTVYFVQGALGLSALARSFFLKDTLHLSPAESAAILGAATLPWAVKPVYGFLSDSLPLLGYRRRSYLILSGIFGSASWLAMSFLVHDAQSALAATLIGSAAIAVADVVIDSIVVERTRESVELAQQTDQAAATSKAGDLQSLCWAASAVGGVISAYWSGSLLEVSTPTDIFAITAVFPMVIAVSAFGVQESRVPNAPSFSELSSTFQSQFNQLKETFLDPNIYLPVLFVFLWRATPSSDSASFYFAVNDLGFKPEYLGRVQVAGSLASLVGILLYRWKLKDFPIKNVIFWTTLVSVPLSLLQLLLVTHANVALGIPNELFFLVDNTVLIVLGQIAFMPTLALAASLCPPGVEGALFASLMSIYNTAGLVSSELGALLTAALGVTDKEFTNLPLLISICSLSSLVTLPFINTLDRQRQERY